MFSRIVARSVRHQYIIKSVRSTWNFVRQQATLAQGSASEAHLNMDVNMRRLPELMKDAIEILSAPWAFHALADELYDVGITYIAMHRRSVELCLAGRLLHFSQKNFQKRRVKRARDRSETVVLTEREKTTYSPTERG